MGAGHGGTQGLHHPGDTVVHRLPAETKIVATVAFVFAVVLTPYRSFLAFAVDGVLLALVICLAGIPIGGVLRRLRIEVPFLAFAVFLPLVGTDPRVDVLGLSLSEPGLWAAWNIVVKGTLGVLAAIILSTTTPVVELFAGLERLRVPRVLTGIASFMVRYLDVITGEANRMRIARLSRADDPRWHWQAKGMAASAGTLFVRSYERGERVHLAMLSRGFTGTLPALCVHRTPPAAWVAAAVVPLVAAGLMVAGHLA